jgi:hypothetical protein
MVGLCGNWVKVSVCILVHISNYPTVIQSASPPPQTTRTDSEYPTRMMIRGGRWRLGAAAAVDPANRGVAPQVEIESKN